jgi:multidrug efflux pump subunit AcrA (membrane-fusion protein)
MATWRLNRSRIGLLGVLASLTLVAGCQSRPKSAEGPLGHLKRGDLIQRVTLAGTIAPKRKLTISPPYAGYIMRLFVKTGDAVKAGSPILSISPSLRETAGESFPLRAQFAGVVVQVLCSEGEYVDPASKTERILTRIDDLSQLYVELDVPEIEVAKLRVGQEALIKSPALPAKKYSGRIEHIALAARDQKDAPGEFPVSIRVTDPDEQLRPGMSVLVDIVVQKSENVLTLGVEYIQGGNGHYSVVLADGSRREIQVGARTSDAFEIKQGLTEADEIRPVDFSEAPSGQ